MSAGEDLGARIGSLLSDPESMQNLAELAAMLRGDDAQTGGQEETLPAPDLAKLMGAVQAIGQVQADENTALLLALKPHLSEARARRAEKAVKLLRLYRAAGILQESGMLSDLL